MIWKQWDWGTRPLLVGDYTHRTPAYRPSFKIPFGQLRQPKIAFLDSFLKFKLTPIIKHSLVNDLPTQIFWTSVLSSMVGFFFFFWKPCWLCVTCPSFYSVCSISLYNKSLVRDRRGRENISPWPQKGFFLFFFFSFWQCLLTVDTQGTSPSRKENSLSAIGK